MLTSLKLSFCLGHNTYQTPCNTIHYVQDTHALCLHKSGHGLLQRVLHYGLSAAVLNVARLASALFRFIKMAHDCQCKVLKSTLF